MKKRLFWLILFSVLCCLAASSCNGRICRHTDVAMQVVDPDCLSDGYTLNTCSACGFSYHTDLVESTGHDHTAVITAPTCTAKGFTTYTCACGDTYTGDFVDALGHKLATEIIAPTCTEDGYTESICLTCEASFLYDQKPATGHAMAATLTMPGCETEGYVTHACASCSHSYITDRTPPLGHDSLPSYLSFATSAKDGTVRLSCQCGKQNEQRTVASASLYRGAYVSGTQGLSYGIDVSQWNGRLDWARLASLGVDFAILKIGSTRSGLDPTFVYNYTEAKKAGIKVGCYYYTYATSVADAKADAEDMLRMMQGYTFDYPVYMDLEDPTQEKLGKQVLTDMCVAFIECLQEAGYYAGLYTNQNWLTNYLDTELITARYDVWLARWRASGAPEWPAAYGTRTGLWQYTDGGVIDGFLCNFDFNVSFFDYPAHITAWGLNGNAMPPALPI